MAEHLKVHCEISNSYALWQDSFVGGGAATIACVSKGHGDTWHHGAASFVLQTGPGPLAKVRSMVETTGVWLNCWSDKQNLEL